MGKIFQALAMILLMSGAALAAEKTPKADDILKTAKLKAADENKAIFLIFGASWCEACHQLDLFLALPDVASIFDKYFVLAKLSFGEGAAGHPEWDTPGANALLLKYGGLSSGGEVALPFLALLDAKAKLIANSKQPGKGTGPNADTGFPTEPGDIKWFLAMLQKAAPAMTDDEARKIQDGLHKATEEN